MDANKEIMTERLSKKNVKLRHPRKVIAKQWAPKDPNIGHHTFCTEQAEQVEQHLQDYKSMKSALRRLSRKWHILVEDVYDLPMGYQPIYKATIVKIKSIIGDRNVCFILDETTDVKQCAIFNILVALESLKIKNFLDALQDDAATVHRAKALIDNELLKDELFNFATYEFLRTAIEKLETQGLAKEKQWKIVTDALQCMDGFAKEKLLASLNRNPDVKAFVENKDPEFRLQTAYAPLVSVDVECSFSLYKSILSDRRQNLTLDKIEMLNV
uniref:DUF4371 domain-containing protein n=1 Tax=Romanomermis culicivorax TaxID=13658 RepID=A0A915I4V6_ROMCU